MELVLSSDQQFFVETTRKFLEAEAPLTAVRELYDDPAGFDRAWWRRGAELGWTSMLVPEDQGGGSVSGAGLLDLALVAEEIGRLVSPGPFLPSNVVAYAVATAGNADQQADVLPGIVAGDLVGAWCIAEADTWGGDGVQMRATPDGDGYVLNGTKTKVEAGGQADWLLVTAESGDGLSQFLLKADTPGITITPMKSLDFTKRFAEVRFDAVKAPASALVGAAGGAAGDVGRQLNVAVVLQCAELCGIASRVFEFTSEYAFDRFSFGRPLASYQELKHRFADMKLWMECSFATTNGAAEAVQAGEADADKLVSVAKSYAGDNLCELIQDCVQIHGGIGVTWDHDIHLYLRRATVDRAIFGSPSEHRDRIADLMGM